MHNSLKFGLIASVMMVIPGVANAQLGGLGGLVGGIVETVDSLLGGSSSSSSAASSSDGLEVEVPGVVDVCIGAACPGGEAIGVEVTVPGVGDVDACVGEACGNNALNLPVCVDALGNAILGCGDNPNPPPGPNPGPLPPVLCVDILGQPIIGVGCPPGGNGGGGNGGNGGAGGNGGGGNPGGNGGNGGGGNPGGNGGGGAGGIAGNGLGPNLDRTALGAVGDQAVCFYVGRNFTGTPYCVGRGAVLNALGGWNNAIQSIRFITPGISVQVCEGENLTGTCTIVTATLAQLFGGWERQISSLRVL